LGNWMGTTSSVCGKDLTGVLGTLIGTTTSVCGKVSTGAEATWLLISIGRTSFDGGKSRFAGYDHLASPGVQNEKLQSMMLRSFYLRRSWHAGDSLVSSKPLFYGQASLPTQLKDCLKFVHHH
jgi:hypothetical protein